MRCKHRQVKGSYLSFFDIFSINTLFACQPISGQDSTKDTSIALRIYTFAECDSMLGFNANIIAKDYLISIYPNPSSGIFTVYLPGNASTTTISVLDIYGQLAEEIKTENKSRVQIKLNHVARGTYMIKVMIDGNVYSGKLVIWY